jgi:hypothetical protein
VVEVVDFVASLRLSRLRVAPRGFARQLNANNQERLMKAPLFEMSADARLLRQELAKVKSGDTIAYRVLGDAIGRKVEGATSALQTARRSLFREEQILFSPVSGEGLYRMRDEDIVSNADRDVTHLRRSARRGVQRLAAVQEYEKLPHGKQLAHSTKMSVMAAVAGITTDKAVKSIEVEAAKSPERRQLPIAQTLAAFVGN